MQSNTPPTQHQPPPLQPFERRLRAAALQFAKSYHRTRESHCPELGYDQLKLAAEFLIDAAAHAAQHGGRWPGNSLPAAAMAWWTNPSKTTLSILFRTALESLATQTSPPFPEKPAGAVRSITTREKRPRHRNPKPRPQPPDPKYRASAPDAPATQLHPKKIRAPPRRSTTRITPSCAGPRPVTMDTRKTPPPVFRKMRGESAADHDKPPYSPTATPGAFLAASHPSRQGRRRDHGTPHPANIPAAANT